MKIYDNPKGDNMFMCKGHSLYLTDQGKEAFASMSDMDPHNRRLNALRWSLDKWQSIPDLLPDFTGPYFRRDGAFHTCACCAYAKLEREEQGYITLDDYIAGEYPGGLEVDWEDVEAEWHCYNCPIMAFTGKTQCQGTPYYVYGKDSTVENAEIEAGFIEVVLTEYVLLKDANNRLVDWGQEETDDLYDAYMTLKSAIGTDCECDNTHAANNTQCCLCYMDDLLNNDMYVDYKEQ